MVIHFCKWLTCNLTGLNLTKEVILSFIQRKQGSEIHKSTYKRRSVVLVIPPITGGTSVILPLMK